LPARSILAHGVHLDAAQVRRAEESGCWIVQNPRSNRHNGVGYPRALGESRHVAVGTDGFVSDMRQEWAVLTEDAAAHGEDAGVTAQRASAGPRLVADVWGSPSGPRLDTELMGACEMTPEGVKHLSLAGRQLVRDGRLHSADIEAIRAQAREAAASLWQRMAELSRGPAGLPYGG
jgi:hypothetical protein